MTSDDLFQQIPSCNPCHPRSALALRFARIERRFIRQRLRRDLGRRRAVVQHTHHAVVGHTSDLGARHVPFLKDPPDDIFLSAPRDDQHSLLRFAQESFVGRHARFAFRHFREIDLHAGTAAAGGLAGRTGQPGRAHVLDAGDRIRGEQFEARFEEQLLLEWIAHLHRGPILASIPPSVRARRRPRPPSPSRPVSAPT